MNAIKRILGLVWIALGPLAVYVIVSNFSQAITRADKIIASANSDTTRALAESARNNTILQWSIITFIFVPIALGLMLFGKYALQGAYDRE